MLPQQHRLRDKRKFEQILKSGKVFQTPIFGLAYLRVGSQTFPRFGFIVSNRISKKAHERNRAKRLLREATQNLMRGVENELLCVVLAKRKILGVSYNEVLRELGEALRKIGAIK